LVLPKTLGFVPCRPPAARNAPQAAEFATIEFCGGRNTAPGPSFSAAPLGGPGLPGKNDLRIGKKRNDFLGRSYCARVRFLSRKRAAKGCAFH